MSVIDQAFVKAYTRRVRTADAADSGEAPVVNPLSPPDVSINPRSEKSAMVWVDAVADQFLRHDSAHHAPVPPPRGLNQPQATAGYGQSAGQPTEQLPGSPSQPAAAVRTRGNRPLVSPPFPHQLAPETLPETRYAPPFPGHQVPATGGANEFQRIDPAHHHEQHSAPFAPLRHDQQQPFQQPISRAIPQPVHPPVVAVSPAVARQTEPQTQRTVEPQRQQVSLDLTPLGELPWLETSSSQLRGPAAESLFFNETVIVQESYWPQPTAAPVTPTVAAASVTPPTIAAAPAPATREIPAAVVPTAVVPVVAAVQPIAATAPVELPHEASIAEPALPFQVAAPPAFSAVWEVDGFEFSSTVQSLFSDPTLIRSIAAPLDRAANEGLQTMLVTSLRRGDGRTTVATGIAMAAATAGLRVVLVDATALAPPRYGSSPADADGITLADSLNLEPQNGWLDALRSGCSIAESAVHSIGDQITVLPLSLLSSTTSLGSDEFYALMQTLRSSFDLIVIDGPPCTDGNFGSLVAPAGNSAAAATVGKPIDAAVLVQNCRHSDNEQANLAIEQLRRDGISGLGLVQNFL